MWIDPPLGPAASQRATKTWRRFDTGVALAVVGVVVWGLLAADSWSNSRVAVERDLQPHFEIDPNRPYEISYYSVSLISGAERSTAVSHDGRVVVKEPRYVDGNREDRTASFVVPAEALAKILHAVKARRVMEWHRSYRLKDTFDGTSSGVVIRQGERVKAVNCRNSSPDGFDAFAEDLDAVTEPYREKAEWQVTNRTGF